MNNMTTRNRCDKCGRFRRWDQLQYHSATTMALNGTVADEEWFECRGSCAEADAPQPNPLAYQTKKGKP